MGAHRHGTDTGVKAVLDNGMHIIQQGHEAGRHVLPTAIYLQGRIHAPAALHERNQHGEVLLPQKHARPPVHLRLPQGRLQEPHEESAKEPGGDKLEQEVPPSVGLPAVVRGPPLLERRIGRVRLEQAWNEDGAVAHLQHRAEPFEEAEHISLQGRVILLPQLGQVPGVQQPGPHEVSLEGNDRCKHLGDPLRIDDHVLFVHIRVPQDPASVAHELHSRQVAALIHNPALPDLLLKVAPRDGRLSVLVEARLEPGLEENVTLRHVLRDVLEPLGKLDKFVAHLVDALGRPRTHIEQADNILVLGALSPNGREHPLLQLLSETLHVGVGANENYRRPTGLGLDGLQPVLHPAVRKVGVVECHKVDSLFRQEELVCAIVQLLSGKVPRAHH
mmetsp:Transcript_10623/g.29786  ORF Transcript_10623/g.29786 Transcript_10623/m.29786 type:complete len:389 (-) Transcript_10623:815-1981(-)